MSIEQWRSKPLKTLNFLQNYIEPSAYLCVTPLSPPDPPLSPLARGEDEEKVYLLRTFAFPKRIKILARSLLKTQNYKIGVEAGCYAGKLS